MVKYTYRGAEIMLDSGLYQLDQQAACQRYRHIRIDAKPSLTAMVEKVQAFRASLSTSQLVLAA